MTDPEGGSPRPKGPEWTAEAQVPFGRRFIVSLVRLFERAAFAFIGLLERMPLAPAKRLARLLRNREFWRFVRFLAVGSLNFAFYYTIFTFLHFLEVEPTRSVAIATVVAVLFNFCTTGRIVFGSQRLTLLPRFIGVYVVQFFANVLALRTLIGLGVPILLAEALVIFVLAIATFFALRRFVFSRIPAKAGAAA